MIFVAAELEPTMILMLAEKDIVTIREGRTLFVDDRFTLGRSFNKVVLSLHANNEEALAILNKTNKGTTPFTVPDVPTHAPKPDEERCSECKGYIAIPLCSRESATSAGPRRPRGCGRKTRNSKNAARRLSMKKIKDMTEPELYHFCRKLARDIEKRLPPGPSAKGKCLFFMAFTDTIGPGISQYTSNVERADAIQFLRETADRLESRQDITRSKPR